MQLSGGDAPVEVGGVEVLSKLGGVNVTNGSWHEDA